jgi:hypothetical protein
MTYLALSFIVAILEALPSMHLPTQSYVTQTQTQTIQTTNTETKQTKQTNDK